MSWKIINPFYVVGKATGEMLHYTGVALEKGGVKLEDLGDEILANLAYQGLIEKGEIAEDIAKPSKKTKES